VAITTKIKHTSSAAIESHLQTSAVNGEQMRKNNITVEEIRKKQGLTELQSVLLWLQELQYVQCGLNPRTHLRNLTIKSKTTIDDHSLVSNGNHTMESLPYPKTNHILPILRQINLQIISIEMKLSKTNTRTQMVDKHRKNSRDRIHPCGTPDGFPLAFAYLKSSATLTKAVGVLKPD
jgi:hypothetical protein